MFPRLLIVGLETAILEETKGSAHKEHSQFKKRGVSPVVVNLPCRLSHNGMMGVRNLDSRGRVSCHSFQRDNMVFVWYSVSVIVRGPSFK